MLAYNQFSGNTTLQSPGLGGFGRKGAQKIVILETDGMANQASGASTYNGGAYQSYYMIRPGDTVTASGSDPATSAVNVATNICALDSSTSSLPGFATARKPVLDQLHRLRRDVRADGIWLGSGVGRVVLAAAFDDRRHGVSQFVDRSDERLQMVHRHVCPTARPSCSKRSSTSWKTRWRWCW